jgi:PAS domain S-box-containing protein
MKFTPDWITTRIKKISLNRMIMGSMMAIAVLLVLVIGHNWSSYENKKFKIQHDAVRSEIIEHQKELVKTEVIRSMDYVNYVRSLSHEKLTTNLKERVEVAWNIADNIYNENKGLKSDSDIKKMIRDAIRPFRTIDKNGYVFIYTLDGESVLSPDSRRFEGTSGLGVKDLNGNYVVKREIALMREFDKALISYYQKLNNPENDSILSKYTYIKKFAPYGWYLGSKEYLVDFERELKLEVLDNLAKIRFGTDGYIFIQSTENKPILSNGIIISESKTIFTSPDEEERQKITEAALVGDGFVEYNYHKPGIRKFEPKVAYVDHIKGWEWIIGAGFYTKDLEKMIAEKQTEQKEEQTRTIIRISIALFAILMLGLILTKQVVKKLDKGFYRFDRFFKEASNDYTLINEKELYSPEFVSLASSANKMVLELKEIRTAFEKEHTLMISVMNSIPDMVFLKDLESRYVAYNNAFLNYLGISEEELVGKTDFELFPLDAAKLYYENDLKILKDRQPIRNEEWVTLTNGDHRLFDTLKVLCQDKSSNILGILCISRDITERQIIQEKYIEAKEKAEEADRLKTAFLANMSHEIRTPMNSIVGFSNLIAEGGLTDDEQSEYVEHINTAINNLLNLINDIIDIAKIEAGQLSIKPEYFDISKLMDDVHISMSEYKNRLSKQHVILEYFIPEELKGVKILTDPFRLNQVLNNLIVNAIKFTSVGSIKFGCELKEGDLYFYVKDSGIGISRKDQELLFKRFRQVGMNSGYKMGGTGLGLAISKHIIDLMNGEIKVESETGKGSTFSFLIPYYPLQEDKKELKMSGTELNDKTVLIIESEEASYSYLKAVFLGTGAKIIRSHNIKEAAEQFKLSDSIDLIYSVINPKDDQLINFIREIKQHKPTIPIIGQTNAPQDILANSLGCDTIISKPVKYHLLLQVIAPFIEDQCHTPT